MKKKDTAIPKKGKPFILDDDFPSGKGEHPYKRTKTKKDRKRKK